MRDIAPELLKSICTLQPTGSHDYSPRYLLTGFCICIHKAILHTGSLFNNKTKNMFQVNFSEQSMNELNQIDTRSQMELVETFSNITQEQLDQPSDDIGCFSRNGKVYYRIRAGDFRIYFEQEKDGLFAHYILHKNTLSDFVFRFKLPITEEFMIEQHDSFWKYLESIRNSSNEGK